MSPDRGVDTPTQLSSKPQPGLVESSSGAVKYLTTVVVLYTIATPSRAYSVSLGLQFLIGIYSIERVPAPLAADADLVRFSEGRALQHVTALTDSGIRLVGTRELDTAADYLLKVGQKLASKARASRPDLLVQVQRELVSGAVETEFLRTGYTNLYNNVTNIVLVISPTAALHEKSVLVNAHFDSTLGTTGASDDASCVGIILELARTIVANPGIRLTAPVIFLMNGAEEALCPAAHGFMQSSPWSRDAGVFLNLESTGPRGPDFLFQQTGEWPMRAFVKAAAYPRGSVVAQDFFQLGLMPADTDYRMFSANLQGSLPGLDTALLLGAGMYHTDRDCMENLRPGTLQAMGENALAVLVEMSHELAHRRQKGEPIADRESVVFFDVLGKFMVMYPFKWARVVHHLPMLMVLTLPYLQRQALQQQSASKIATGLAKETLAAVLSMAGALGSCILLAVLRVAVLGNPMAWYGSTVLPYVLLAPAGVAGLFLPYLGRQVDCKLSALGNTLAFALLSSALTQAGIGASVLGTIWALAGLLTLTNLEVKSSQLLKAATGISMVPVLLFLPNALALCTYVLEKASLTGSLGGPPYSSFVADVVAAVLIGVVVISLSGFMTPWIVFGVGKKLQGVVVSLYAASFAVAVLLSLTWSPYTDLAPKKLFLQHLHEHDTHGRITSSALALGAVDSVPSDSLLKGRVNNMTQTSGWEWQTFFPFNERFISGRRIPAPKLQGHLETPSITLDSRKQLSRRVEELTFQPHLPDQAFLGSMNITASILDWSLPASETPAHNKGTLHSRFVRFVGRGPEANMRFSLSILAGSNVTIRLAAAHTARNEVADAFLEDFPAWTFTAKVTTFLSEWQF